MGGLYSKNDKARVIEDLNEKDAEPYRTPWRRDYARLIHCPSFRRLQGKTQVFPGHEFDFYRNRLTHSLEVAQIAKSIAIRLNATAPEFRRKGSAIQPEIVEFAGLAHDLGHPPFGHNGEQALDERMRNHGGFEGNAQTLRIVARLEKKATLHLVNGEISAFDGATDLRCGLNLTYRSLASLIKYDRMIPERDADREKPGTVMKGYFAEEADLVAKIKRKVLSSENPPVKFKTVECSIMDIADDIAYSTYDLEDNFKAGFLTPMSLFALDDSVYSDVAETIVERVRKQYPEREDSAVEIDGGLVQRILFYVFEEILFGVGDELMSVIRSRRIEWQGKKMLVAAEVQGLSRKLAVDGYHRTKFTSELVQLFISGIEVISNEKYPQLTNVRLEFNTFLVVEVLKNITYHAIIKSSGLQVVEYRGKDIVKAIFDALDGENGIHLLPDDFRLICKGAAEIVKMRTICDFIAGMTDRYALEFYSRLHGANILTIHKPF